MKYAPVYLIAIAWTASSVKAQPQSPTDIQPQSIEVGYTKTVHLLFSSAVTYIDIGSMDILAGKADGAENVVRVKAAVRDFKGETNLTVITEEGGFYTFDARYAENPAISTFSLTPTNQKPDKDTSLQPAMGVGSVFLQEVGREKPATVKRLMNEIYRQNRTDCKGIRAKKYGMEVAIRGIYIHNDVIYIHTQLSNETNISFETDYLRFSVVDKKLAKRTAQQQTPVEILRTCNPIALIRAHQRQRSVYALPKFTISDDKMLLLEIVERNRARHQAVEISGKELLAAKTP